jgi:8-oxo-dGTP pyrophosphatase MutT (NUDIX family)
MPRKPVPHISLELQLQTLPPIMERGRHVLILVHNGKGHFLLGEKHIYPEGIVRMVGGGVEGDEIWEVAAAREVQEELGVTVEPSALTPLAEITAHIRVAEREVTFTTCLFEWVTDDLSQFKGSDDLDGLRILNMDEMVELIGRYGQLSKEIEDDFCWYDYGQLYGRVHQLALELCTTTQGAPNRT